MMHNTHEQNEAFRKAWDSTNARWKAQTNKAKKMTHSEIIDFYDTHPDLTLAQLAQITGLTVAQLKIVLMPGAVS